MGSDSDLSTMEAAVEVLRHFQVPLEVTVVSAHRTPERLINYGRGAHHRGIKVLRTAVAVPACRSCLVGHRPVFSMRALHPPPRHGMAWRLSRPVLREPTPLIRMDATPH